MNESLEQCADVHTKVLWTNAPRAAQLMSMDLRAPTRPIKRPQDPTAESTVTDRMTVGAPVKGSLKDASVNRLACLLRHWAWADEAMAQFESKLSNKWESEDNPLADQPSGAYYHWCALLCGFSDAALEHGLLSGLQLGALRRDLERSLPWLRACRQLLVVIPASLEEHQRIVDLLHDDQTLARLRRIHSAIGEALREEYLSRGRDWLLYEY